MASQAISLVSAISPITMATLGRGCNTTMALVDPEMEGNRHIDWTTPHRRTLEEIGLALVYPGR
jgi:hypothetical protein